MTRSASLVLSVAMAAIGCAKDTEDTGTEIEIIDGDFDNDAANGGETGSDDDGTPSESENDGVSEDDDDEPSEPEDETEDSTSDDDAEIDTGSEGSDSETEERETGIGDDEEVGDAPGGSLVIGGAELPAPVPPVGTRGELSTISFEVPSGNIVDLNVQMSLTHTCTTDLTATLVSPSGTRVVLFDLTSRPVCSSDLAETILDDEADTAIASGSSPFTGAHKPTGLLSDFDGENAQGVWNLIIIDDTIGDRGSLTDWAIDLKLD